METSRKQVSSAVLRHPAVVAADSFFRLSAATGSGQSGTSHRDSQTKSSETENSRQRHPSGKSHSRRDCRGSSHLIQLLMGTTQRRKQARQGTCFRTEPRFAADSVLQECTGQPTGKDKYLLSPDGGKRSDSGSKTGMGLLSICRQPLLHVP